MTTCQRLKAIKAWLTSNACKGRTMKAKPKERDDLTILYREPSCHLLLYPARDKPQEPADLIPVGSAPCILILMNRAGIRDTAGRFDERKGTHRPDEMRGFLELQLMFITYDPGHRTEKSQTTKQFSDIEANDEEAGFVPLDWAEETMTRLLAQMCLPGTDLTVDNVGMDFGPLKEYGYLVDKRPLYYAVLNVVFGCASQEVSMMRNSESAISRLLD